MVQDYPDGFSRDVPGHTVELESGFSLPWLQSASLTIAAGGNSSFTVNFNDPNWIYYIDMINVTAQAYTEFYIFVEVNGVVYAAAADMGTVIINLRMNPSILFIDGDSVKVTVYNKDSSQRTFAVHINGSKIIRPSTYGHPPSASWHASNDIAVLNEDISFTDDSAYDPTEWDWDFDDGTPHSTAQNPVHAYSNVGNYYPILKASNQYGFDTYARASPISIVDYVNLTTFTEADPGNKITVASVTCTFSNLDTSTASYVYKDYGSDYFDSYDIKFRLNVGSIATNGFYIFPLGLANNVGTLYNAGGIKVVMRFYRNASGTYELQLIVMNGTTWTSQATNAANLNTDYYVRVQHSSGSTTVTAKVYSDINYSNLLFTLTLTHNYVNTKFRYLFIFSGIGTSTSQTASGSTGNLLLL